LCELWLGLLLILLLLNQRLLCELRLLLQEPWLLWWSLWLCLLLKNL